MDTEASNNNSPQNQEDENRPLIGEVDFPFEVTVACGPVKWSIETHASDLHFSFAQVRMKLLSLVNESTRWRFSHRRTSRRWQLQTVCYV